MKVLRFLLVLFGIIVAEPVLAATPKVLELYQSQGCSSCPPAISNANALADRPDVLVLMFAVTYWDRLGWKDTFAKPEFTQRQYDYASGLGHRGVYTPQVVLNGSVALVGSDKGELNVALNRVPALSGPMIALEKGAVEIASGVGHNSDVWLVRYDPRVLNIAVRSGENAGVTIAHRDIVRQLIRLGSWSGQRARYALSQGGEPDWRTAILVQEANGGPILSALRVPS